MKKIHLFTGAIALIATNSIFTACGNSFTDSRDGQKYKTVKIGDNIWMAEKLKYMGKDSYTWEEALAACPEGWHLPSKSELKTVIADTTNIGNIWSSTEEEDLSLRAYNKDYNKLYSGAKINNLQVQCVQGNGEKQQQLKEVNGHKAVRIGKQIWMAKNMDVETPNSVCYLEDEEECSKGRYYSISEARTICPEGWRLPNKKDAITLINKLRKVCEEASTGCWPWLNKVFFQAMGYCNKLQFEDSDYTYWLLNDGNYLTNFAGELKVQSPYSWQRTQKFNVRCIADSENKE